MFRIAVIIHGHPIMQHAHTRTKIKFKYLLLYVHQHNISTLFNHALCEYYYI